LAEGRIGYMEIQYKGIITRKDFLRCLLLLNPLKWQKWLFGTVLGAIILSFVYLWTQGSFESVRPLLDLGPTILIPVVFLLFPWWWPYLQLTAYNQRTNIYRNEVFGKINDREITINNQEVSATLKWSVYSGYTLDKELLLLRQGRYAFNAFKPAMFSSRDDWERFISLVKSKTFSK
jgi:hypothetical protein